jgi:toxin YoeB
VADRVALFELAFREDLAHWIAVQPRLAVRLMDLVEAVVRDPFR